MSVGGKHFAFFTIIILSGILCVFCSQVAHPAEITVVDNNVFVETDTYEVQFLDGVITYLSNKLTGEAYTLPLGVGGVTGFRGRSGLLKRDGRSIWTDQATLTEARKVAPLQAEIVFRQGRNEFRAFNEPGWVDAHISLSEHAGETVLLELVTDSGETVSCDYAHWADLFITASIRSRFLGLTQRRVKC